MIKQFKIIRLETIQLLLVAGLMALMAPFVKVIMIYLNYVNTLTYYYINIFFTWGCKTFNIHQNVSIWTKITAQLFWPFIFTLFIDKLYPLIRKKRFEHNYLCALILWLIFNGSTIILQ